MFSYSKSGKFLPSGDKKWNCCACVRKFRNPANLILGQPHFIKTAEDLYEVVVNTIFGAKFAAAFNEAYGSRLIRVEANDHELREGAISNARSIGAGHVFVLLIRQAYPIIEQGYGTVSRSA
jgi:hypothetical protein